MSDVISSSVRHRTFDGLPYNMSIGNVFGFWARSACLSAGLHFESHESTHVTRPMIINDVQNVIVESDTMTFARLRTLLFSYDVFMKYNNEKRLPMYTFR